jgi:hypothetical protein
MGLKTDTSFLRFLSMGALGVRQTMKQLSSMGFQPIELERYCASNKIWMTKVKRLRLPDLLCVRTGLRLEVRAKSDLRIRMSDAPNNPDRTWDSGLRDNDVAAFIAITDEAGGQRPADEAVFFSIGALRASVSTSTLGPPKSASEGAERDRTWPAIIPSSDGTVDSVTAEKLVVSMAPAAGGTRKQTYTLKGKKTYVRPGDRFRGEVSILAGAPETTANISAFLNQTYDPLAGLREPNAVDRYAAAKSLPYRKDLLSDAVPALESLLKSETEERVALEAAGASATLGSKLGQDYIGKVLWGDGRKDLRMEAVLILTELGSEFARSELIRVAGDAELAGDEIRQAAVWGLGKTGLKAYDQILPFIGDEDENLALHAIAAFGSDTPEDVIRKMVSELLTADSRRASAASETLRLIANETVLTCLIEAAASGHDWVLATLGRLPAALVKTGVADSELMKRIAPMLLMGEGANWLASEDRVMDIAFLTKQNL